MCFNSTSESVQNATILGHISKNFQGEILNTPPPQSRMEIKMKFRIFTHKYCFISSFKIHGISRRTKCWIVYYNESQVFFIYKCSVVKHYLLQNALKKLRLHHFCENFPKVFRGGLKDPPSQEGIKWNYSKITFIINTKNCFILNLNTRGILKQYVYSETRFSYTCIFSVVNMCISNL